ncbi:MAG: hypothetical protein PHI63_04745 [Patescibacteria group bacterium]|nr:hypothetical protein [Patescibacteria group bacterium]
MTDPKVIPNTMHAASGQGRGSDRGSRNPSTAGGASSHAPIVHWQLSEKGGGRSGVRAQGRTPLPQVPQAVNQAIAAVLGRGGSDAQRSREFRRDQQRDKRKKADPALARQREENAPRPPEAQEQKGGSESAGKESNGVTQSAPDVPAGPGGQPADAGGSDRERKTGEPSGRDGQPAPEGGAAGGAPAGPGGQAGPQKMDPYSGGERVGKVAMPRGAVKDINPLMEEWRRDKESGDARMRSQRDEWDRTRRDYQRPGAPRPYSPRSAARGQSGGSPAIGPTPPLAAGNFPKSGGEAPAAGENTAPDNGDEERRRQQQLLREVAQDRRLLERGRTRWGEGISSAQMRRISEHGRGLSRRMAAAGRHSNAPYIFVLVLSVVNDLVDIFDISLFFPLDQIFDVCTLMLMLAARLFVREELGQQSSSWFEWIGTKIVTCLAEWTPVVGVLPMWTISAVWVWRRAVVRRRREQYRSAEEAAAERAGMPDSYEAEGEAYPQEEPGVA